MVEQTAVEHIGETRPTADHDFDLVEELSHRMKSLWRIDQRIANAEDKPELQQFWRTVKRQDQETVDRMRELIKQECAAGCF
ncbi:MAG: hypothetical protein SYC29_00615 [Planctomycetota bacterium]|nr:hypothetical protein [Planctomycetota bacterium]